MKSANHNVVPLHQKVQGSSMLNKDTGLNRSTYTVETKIVGRLKFTICANSPSEEAMEDFNEFFQDLFEKSLIDTDDALPA